MYLKIRVDDTLRYSSDIIVEVPNNISDNEIAHLLETAQENLIKPANYEDVVYEIEQQGYTVIESVSGYPNNPDNTECEITEYDKLDSLDEVDY